MWPERGPQLVQIDGCIPRLEPNVLAIGVQPSRARIVEQGAELGQTPAEGRARIVRPIPEQRAEALAQRRTPRRAQVTEERPRLL
jgi:hypothetical protein